MSILTHTAGVGLVVGLLWAGEARALTVTTVVNNGTPARRIDIVVMGDRYTSADMTKFRTDVDKVIAKFKAQSPWKDYWAYVNVHRVEVVSTANTSAGPLGTYLSGDRCWFANSSAVNNYAALAPDNEVRFVLVNSTTYGGCATYGGIAVGYNGTYSDWVSVHEVGHQFGLLADEYDYSGGATYAGAEPYEANATTVTNRATTKWAPWIDAATAIPTPPANTTAVGLFEGCRYNTHGIYRPKSTCMMEALGQPFCEICRQQVTRRLYIEGNPINALVSSTGSFTVASGTALTLTPQEIAPFALSFVWSVDGVVKGAGATFLFEGASYAAGTHTVRATATDLTSFVRGTAPTAFLEQTVTVGDANALTGLPMVVKIKVAAVNVLAGSPLTGLRVAGTVYAGEMYVVRSVKDGRYVINFAGRVVLLPMWATEKLSGRQAVTVTPTALPVYQGPDSRYFRLGTVYAGQMYVIEYTSGNWYRIRYGYLHAGWIPKSSVTVQNY